MIGTYDTRVKSMFQFPPKKHAREISKHVGYPSFGMKCSFSMTMLEKKTLRTNYEMAN